MVPKTTVRRVVIATVSGLVGLAQLGLAAAAGCGMIVGP